MTEAGTDERRHLTDPQRMLWRDDVDGICSSPDICFEYGDHVRCGPCAIRQATACGVETDYSVPNIPEVSRLQRTIAAISQSLPTPQWRCVNCKTVTTGHLKPDRRPECNWCVGFAEVAAIQSRSTPVSGTDAVEVFRKWQSAEHIKLHLGEMTAQEIRCVKAALEAVGREVIAPTPGSSIPTIDAVEVTQDVRLIDARTIAAVYLDADMSDVFSGGYDSHPIVCAALDGLRGSTRTEELVTALEGLMAKQGYGEPQLSDGRLMGDESVVNILCTLGDLRRARAALASHRGEGR